MTAPIRDTGPVLRATVTVHLPVERGTVTTPAPTMEHGGLPHFPAGTVVRLDIGAAIGCFMSDIAKIAGAVCDAAEIEVTGTDRRGVTATRDFLAAAIERTRQRTG